MNGDRFYTKEYSNFTDSGKAVQTLSPYNLTPLVITQSKSLAKKIFER